MQVTDNLDGTFTLTLTPEERAAFSYAVANRLVPGSDAAAMLQQFIGQSFTVMVTNMRREMLSAIADKLPHQTLPTLQTMLAGLG